MRNVTVVEGDAKQLNGWVGPEKSLEVRSVVVGRQLPDWRSRRKQKEKEILEPLTRAVKGGGVFLTPTPE
jgi:hypothetical protein